MQHYAMIFRSTRALTPEEQSQRTIDIAAWVQHVTAMGIELEPRNFGQLVANLSVQGNERVSRLELTDPSLATIVFFDSPSKEQAIDIARIHPGLRYGVNLELREWTSPRQSAAAS